MTDYYYPRKGFSIKLDMTRDALLSEIGVETLRDRYFLKSYNTETGEWVYQEHSPQECFARSACEYATNKQHAQRLYDYVSKQWAMFATPILSNGGTERGLPISCFLSLVADSREGIGQHWYENIFLASTGGGIGTSWSKLRANGTRTSKGNVSTGVIPFMKVVDTEMNAVSQGATRRGSYAAYLDISHPEILEFIDIRNPHTGDLNRRCLGKGFHHAVNITDDFMEAVETGSKWKLVDPRSKEVKEEVDARTLWMKLLTTRLELGEPYLHFIDTANAALNPMLKAKGLKIHSSNLCSEIALPTDYDRTAVCCLSSVNLATYDEWKNDPLFIGDMIEFLDNVLQSFIETAPKELWRAVNSATKERSIGLGAMGFHTLLQKKMIPFESPSALVLNETIFKQLKEKALEKSKELAVSRGEPSDIIGSGMRFSHLLAVAPNANISLFCGNVSPSIEPYNANAFTQRTLSGAYHIKNTTLDRLLREHYKLDAQVLEDVWSFITINNGSVQDIPWMEPKHKEVFKTALELDQTWIIEHASVRQEFICQSQSVNLFLPPDVHKNDLHKVHYLAWKKGLKGLYYLRSDVIKKVESVTKVDISNAVTYSVNTDCIACEG